MITIKGLHQGLLVIVGPGSWHDQLRELEGKLSNSANFFRGGRVALDVRDLPLGRDDIERARELLAGFDVRLWAVLSQNAGTANHVRALGLDNTLSAPEWRQKAPRRKPEPPPTARAAPPPAVAPTREMSPPPADGIAPPAEAIDGGTDGVLTRRRVRSGQVLRHPGHIVVVGDVNPGAQLIAGGDIIVWGKLQGSAHAGALGDSGAIVGALVMQPSALRIADTQLIHSGADKRRPRGPLMARLRADGIVLTAWQER